MDEEVSVSSQPVGPSIVADPDFAVLVADYLRRHPGFFDDHPDVLAAMQVPHLTSGGTVSLIEHQVRLLRKQLAAERGRLAHLISRARDYEALSTRLHALVLQLLAVNDPDQLCHLLREALLREFHADAIALELFAQAVLEGQEPDALALAFADFVDRQHALCGPLDASRAALLFGESGAGVRTAALVPIRTDGHSGVLAIGSVDPERFNPDMGTDFLDRLGEIVSHKLHAVPIAPCGQD